MLSRIADYFRTHLQAGSGADDGERGQCLRLAASALLVEVARADFDYADSEREQVAALIARTLDVPPEELQKLQQLAEAESEQATSLHQFTTLIHEHFDDAQKARLMESLWRVALADGQLHKREEHLLRRIADLLYIPHETYIRSRHRVETAAR